MGVVSCAVAFLTVTAISALATAQSVADRNRVPNGNAVAANGHFWPAVFHDTWRGTTAQLNPFGTAFVAAGKEWTASLCQADSDGDGFTNGEELGDPACVWRPGNSTSRATDISHPGLWSSVPPEKLFSARAQSPPSGCMVKSLTSVVTTAVERAALRSSVVVPSGLTGVTPHTSQLVNVSVPTTADVFTASGLPAGVCPQTQVGVEFWHDAATWSPGAVPAVGADVTLPVGKKVVIGACSVWSRGYGKITVPTGTELILADDNVNLRVKDIVVSGVLRVGSSECPVHSPVTIQFYALKTETAYSNGIMVIGGGVVEFFGATSSLTWTRLRATAVAGEKVLVLQDAVDWSVYEEIVVITSIWQDESNNQNEVRRISAVDAANRSLVELDIPLSFEHYGGPEYQSEVALLWRPILLRGDVNGYANAYGGHVMAIGASATLRAVSARAEMMGQRNIMARYPFHLHMMYEGGATSYFQQLSCVHSYYRCYTIHGTNRSLLRKNVAFNSSGHTYYFEDGGEMYNTVEYNLAAYVHPIGRPAAGGAQVGESFTEDPLTALQPADHTASGFYFPNAHNIIRGNAASGGWSGFSFPIFDTCLKLSSNLTVIPKAQPMLIFDGNTAHSSGTFWDDAGCVYHGGRLAPVSATDPRMKYSNGRYSAPTVGSHNVTNLKTWLCNFGFASWGERVIISTYEAHDVVRSAVLFGDSAFLKGVVTGTSGNMPEDMLDLARQGFQYYDVNVQTMLVNITFRNYWIKAQESKWLRGGVIVDLDHSDIHKPWGISANRALALENVDRAITVRRWVRETGASRFFNFVDWDGSVLNNATCGGFIVGSDIPWWNAYPDCWLEGRWPAWVCPRSVGRQVVGIDMDLPGIQQELDYLTDSTTDSLTQAQRDQLYIGQMTYFGAQGGKRLQLTRNHHLATGVSQTGWYMWLQTGVPKSIVMWPTNFPRGTSILLAISYPAGTKFVITQKYRWQGSSDQSAEIYRPAASREEVLLSNGTYYHFDGRHLYLKIGDWNSPFPFAYSGSGVDVYNAQQWSPYDLKVVATCTTNSDGFCVTPSAPDVPVELLGINMANVSVASLFGASVNLTKGSPASWLAKATAVYGYPVKECTSDAEFLVPPPLCGDDVPDSPPASFNGTCAQYKAQLRCASYPGPYPYCTRTCATYCKRYMPFPYTCSRTYADGNLLTEPTMMPPCSFEQRPAPKPDWCLSTMNNQPLNDPCSLATCRPDTGSMTRLPMASGTPCAGGTSGLGINGFCHGSMAACVTVDQGWVYPILPFGAASSPTGAIINPTTVPQIDDAERSRIRVYVNVANLTRSAAGSVVDITAVYYLAHSNVSYSVLLTAEPNPSGQPGRTYFSASITEGHVARRVNITARYAVPGRPIGSSSASFEDWARTGSVNPSIVVVSAPPLGMTGGNVTFQLKPLDWVATATLILTSMAHQRSTVMCDLVANHGVTCAFPVPATSLSPLSAEAPSLRVVMRHGVRMQYSVPCLARSIGAVCPLRPVDVRPPSSSCLFILQINKLTTYFNLEAYRTELLMTGTKNAGQMEESLSVDLTVDNVTVMMPAGNISLPVKYGTFQGNVGGVPTSSVMVETLLSNGQRELFMTPYPVPKDLVEGKYNLLCVRGINNNNNDAMDGGAASVTSPPPMPSMVNGICSTSLNCEPVTAPTTTTTTTMTATPTSTATTATTTTTDNNGTPPDTTTGTVMTSTMVAPSASTSTATTSAGPTITTAPIGPSSTTTSAATTTAGPATTTTPSGPSSTTGAPRTSTSVATTAAGPATTTTIGPSSTKAPSTLASSSPSPTVTPPSPSTTAASTGVAPSTTAVMSTLLTTTTTTTTATVTASSTGGLTATTVTSPAPAATNASIQLYLKLAGLRWGIILGNATATAIIRGTLLADITALLKLTGNQTLSIDAMKEGSLIVNATCISVDNSLTQESATASLAGATSLTTSTNQSSTTTTMQLTVLAYQQLTGSGETPQLVESLAFAAEQDLSPSPRSGYADGGSCREGCVAAIVIVVLLVAVAMLVGGVFYQRHRKQTREQEERKFHQHQDLMTMGPTDEDNPPLGGDVDGDLSAAATVITGNVQGTPVLPIVEMENAEHTISAVTPAGFVAPEALPQRELKVGTPGTEAEEEPPRQLSPPPPPPAIISQAPTQPPPVAVRQQPVIEIDLDDDDDLPLPPPPPLPRPPKVAINPVDI